MSTSTYTIYRGDGSSFATTGNKGVAMRLAARLGGFVTTTLFGQAVRVEG